MLYYMYTHIRIHTHLSLSLYVLPTASASGIDDRPWAQPAARLQDADLCEISIELQADAKTDCGCITTTSEA